LPQEKVQLFSLELQEKEKKNRKKETPFDFSKLESRMLAGGEEF